MERRIAERHRRHLQVRVWRHGTDEMLLGHTSNISRTGLYVVAMRIFPSGTRVRLEVGESRGFWAEGLVVRSLSAPPVLRKVKPTGMGIRFLEIPELVAELIEGQAIQTVRPGSERPTPAPAGGASTGERVDPAAAASQLPAAPQRDEPSVAPAVGAPPGPQQHDGGRPRYRLQLPHGEALARVIERDLAAGGLFVPTLEPLPLDSVLVVEVSVGNGGEGVGVLARVVHRIDPAGPDGGFGGPNLMAGMGVEVLEPAAARAALSRLL